MALGAGHPEAKGRPARCTPTNTAGADSRRAGTLPHLPAEFFKVGSELEHCLRDVYWMPGKAMPDGLKPFANGMNYGIQSLFSATCHTMEAMERYASAHIAGEELMRRGAQ